MAQSSRARKRAQSGVTLIESLLALSLLGLVAVAILPAFMTQMDSTSNNLRRAAAVTAVQRQIESLRRESPASMPTTGSSAPLSIAVDDFEFSVITHYCTNPSFCDGSTRHLIVEAQDDEGTVYDAETVFTQLF